MTTATTLVYRLGEPDIECRYPVIIGEDRVIGQVYRWHRDWLAVTAEGEQERNLRRPPKGAKGVDMAATFLAEEYAAGRVQAVALDQLRAEAPRPLIGPVPLLHPRMPVGPRNIAGARVAFAGLTEHHWRAVLHGFPGSDNPWYLRCELCSWSGIRYWSHHRGRNGNPPSAYRHDGGCIGADQVRELIPAYQK
ncbi:hypothetical protein [Streptomyces sp. NPDC001089]